MTTTSSPPIIAPRALTTVFSGFHVRLESLNGSLTRTTSCTPSMSSNSRGSMSSTLPTTPRIVWSEPVERWTSNPRVVSSAITCSMLISLVCFCITITILCFSLWGHPPGPRGSARRGRALRRCCFSLYPPRFVDDALEQTPYGDPVERALGGSLGTPKHLLFALRRVDRQAEDGLHFSDLDGVLGPLVEQPHDHFIDAVDGAARAFDLALGFRSFHNKKPLPAVGKGF